MKKGEKMIVYSVLPRLFDNRCQTRKPGGDPMENGCGKMESFSPQALEMIRSLGTTHIWYIGMLEQATQTNYSDAGILPCHPEIVKGKAGSPYAVRDYYDVSPELATNIPNRMAEFHDLIERTHRAGMGVIMDFVPNHVAREYRSDVKPSGTKDLGEGDDPLVAFSPNNNFYYLPGKCLELDFGERSRTMMPYHEEPARATGNDRFSSHIDKEDWYETVKLNYGIDYLNGGSKHFDPLPDTWIRMRDILLFWASKGIDGFRCDMAEMVPVKFWEWAIPQIRERHSVLFIAEIYRPELYESYLQAGFDYLYDKVGMYDCLRAVICGYGSASDISRVIRQTERFADNMLYFLENHDEQRIASDFFAEDARKALPAVTIAATIGRNPFMLYFAQELGERGMDAEGFSGKDGRTTIFDYWSLDKMQRRINDGRYDTTMLSEEERLLLESYTRLLHDVCTLPSVIQGNFYDLGYANQNNPYFRPNREFAFLRHTTDEILLVAANFAPHEAEIRVIIPEHAFQTMQIKDNAAFLLTDMLSGENSIGCLTQYAPYPLHLPAYGYALHRFRPL
ncbi:alpha-amylase family glycosyl hydrolase [Porphyromonas gingivalis]|uniref:alpha-amylase family glycosyl hydrolase n=1 Tax=Porphyromonas gingivalis TaxID=837 RepID=UPI000C1A2ABF|nr:alpha-amylase family glycosyl hydrolase [Porphyromonas gingivalis]ATS01371.1 alpha-amylase [Porphyromonas gingivalis]MCE8182291.1 alpha-amylase [Porphyromonas gingivalis]MDP0530484.1 alpha-amylase family glycosyl hydrolase [Porphyromonas gingivalis]MDP0624386.1 alpha-amylase family glycosyl hydrolase [Porphyromonas gingivalis]WKD53474.1 alpha-amylase family glycosyl hydrolase [Porphyromonas gingivalis]